MRFPVFDLHCDTALALLDASLEQTAPLRRNGLHVDLERARKYPGYAQCFACFTSPLQEHAPQRIFSRERQVLRQQIEQNRDLITFAASPAQIEQNLEKGLASAILTIEGPAGFDYDPKQLQRLYSEGFRITTLGWNEKNPLTGSHLTGGGLSALGREYVRQAQRLGMLIDVSHISDEGFWDIMEIATAPVIASHSNSRAVWNASRNLTDEMFLAICRIGGVVGINLYADFLGDNPDLNTVCKHILHFLELDPTGMHIALGGDLDGCDRLPDGFRGIEDYDVLAQCLLNHELKEETVRNIFWNNAIGVMERCCI